MHEHMYGIYWVDKFVASLFIDWISYLYKFIVVDVVDFFVKIFFQKTESWMNNFVDCKNLIS